MSPQEAPTRVYTPEPLQLGPGQALSPAQGLTQPLVVMQAPTKPEPAGSWISTHKGDLIAGTGAGLLVITLMLTVAVVAIAVGIGAISCAVGWIVIKGLMGPETKK